MQKSKTPRFSSSTLAVSSTDNQPLVNKIVPDFTLCFTVNGSSFHPPSFNHHHSIPLILWGWYSLYPNASQFDEDWRFLTSDERNSFYMSRWGYQINKEKLSIPTFFIDGLEKALFQWLRVTKRPLKTEMINGKPVVTEWQVVRTPSMMNNGRVVSKTVWRQWTLRVNPNYRFQSRDFDDIKLLPIQ